jgi:hypothetical protein
LLKPAILKPGNYKSTANPLPVLDPSSKAIAIGILAVILVVAGLAAWVVLQMQNNSVAFDRDYDALALLALLFIGAVLTGTLGVVVYFSPAQVNRRKIYNEQMRIAREQREERMRIAREQQEEQARIVREQQQAAYDQQCRNWLLQIVAEMQRGEMPENSGPALAIVSAARMSIMVRCLVETGGAAFSEAEFGQRIEQLWLGLKSQDFDQLPMLRSYLGAILQGFVNGWKAVNSSGCFTPQLVGAGFGVKGILEGMAISAVAQIAAHKIASHISDTRAHRGLTEMAQAADAFAALADAVNASGYAAFPSSFQP